MAAPLSLCWWCPHHKPACRARPGQARPGQHEMIMPRLVSSTQKLRMCVLTIIPKKPDITKIPLLMRMVGDFLLARDFFRSEQERDKKLARGKRSGSKLPILITKRCRAHAPVKPKFSHFNRLQSPNIHVHKSVDVYKRIGSLMKWC